MEKIKNTEKHSKYFFETPSVFTNISLQFTGIGHLIIHGNAFISYIESKYNLKVENLPLNTFKHGFLFFLANCRTAGFEVITIFYEEEENIHKKVVLEFLKTLFPYKSIEEFNQYIKNERVALVMGDISEKSMYFLYQCVTRNMYVALMDKLEFCVPFVNAFVFSPLPIRNEEAIVFNKSGEKKSKEINFVKESEDDHFVYSNFDGEVSYDVCMSLLEKGFSEPYDGRTLHSKGELPLIDENNDYGINTKPTELVPEKIELDLLVNFKQMNLHSTMIHCKNIQKSAMSLFNGQLLFSPIVRSKEKTKPLKISKKQQAIIEESEKRIKSKELEQDKLWLKSFYLKYVKADKEGKKTLLETVNPIKPSLYKRILLLRIEYYAEIWKLELHSEDCDERLLIPCYSSCIEFIEKFLSELPTNDPHLEFVIQTLIDCGFEATAHEIVEKNKLDLKLNFYTEDTSAPSDYDICFQLKYMGDKLKRNLGSRKDKRVLFEPDEWQIKLLDLVDQNKSAVVAAPTSSGKTFICFYAIEKILRESDDDMVIFCLPTKALANQVSADIYARFTPKVNCKTNIQGFLMKDNSNNPFNCQVLITIPSLLESILNSPPSKGLKRIKYIIIDEVHKISSEEMGSPIERIFHLSPCPLLVLSATLGNLNGFYKWMKAIENSKGRECELVVHRERFCELKPFVYTKTNNTSSVVPINNLFAYSYEHIRKFGFGNDLNFLPEELLELFDTLCTVLTESQKELIYPLVPENFFKSNILRKKDCKEYEKHLLGYFQNLIKNDLVTEKQIKAVYKLLTRESRKAFEHIESFDEDYIAENIIELLNHLKESDMLPCIVFNTDRDFINRLALRVYQKLEALDKEVKKNKTLEKMKKETKRNRDVEKGKDSWIEESLIAERNFELKDDKKNINYTFLDPATKVTDYELENEINYIKNTQYEFLDMMFRGIGVHHEQMNRRYRNVAEILFRKKHIRVLFATDTLALGINVPCRTVVFAGDSLLLDPLNLKQMAGRAGRRGFDTLGNVIFLGIPQNRVQNLLVSRLPNIKGVYTYTNSSFVGFNIKDSLIKYPLLTSTFYGNKKDTVSHKLENNCEHLLADLSLSSHKPDDYLDSCNKKYFYDLNNIFLNTEQREKLVGEQLNLLFPLFEQNSFYNELIISNRETDPSIFILILLLESNVINFDSNNLMIILSHLFEVKPLLFPTQHTLPPLQKDVYDLCSKINDIKRISTIKLYSGPLKALQSYTNTPLHNILSFIQVPYFDYPKNSYLLDFYKHSNVKRIREENNIRSADLFKSLSVINNVFTSLIRWYNKYNLDKETLRKIQNVYSIFESKFKGIFA